MSSYRDVRPVHNVGGRITTARFSRVLVAIVAAGAALGTTSLPAKAGSIPYGTVLIAGAQWAGAYAALGDLNIYSNGSGNQDQMGTFGLQYECTDLVQRWAHYRWGEPDAWPISRAADMWNVGPSLPVPLSQNPNGGANPPQFGDIVVYGATPADPTGHVGIVAGVTASSVTVAQENFTVNGTPTGEWTQALNGTSVPPLGGSPVVGWLRSGAPAAPAPTPPLVSASAPTTTITPDGSAQIIFWRGADNHLDEKWFSRGSWNGPVDVSADYFGGGAPLSSAPVATVTTTGVQLVFWRGPWNHVFEAWYNGHWNGPVDATTSYFGGNAPLSSAPSATVLRDGTQIVFWQGPWNHVYEAWWNGHWNGPVDVAAAYFGGNTLGSAPSVALTTRGEQVIFWRDGAGHLIEAWWNGRWNGPIDVTADYFGGAAPLSSSPSVAVTSDGTQLVFWQGPSGHLYEAWWKGHWNGPGDWTAAAFAGAGTLTSAPSVAVTGTGAQLVFWQGGSRTVWEAWFTARWNGPAEQSS